MSITNKREVFAKEYVKSGNPSASYRKAYKTSNMKPATISNNAYKLLKNNDVATRIKELKKIAAEIADKEFRTDSRELLRHLTILRKSRIDQFVDFVDVNIHEEGEDGRPVFPRTERVLQFKPFIELSEEQLMCIESIKNGRDGIELKLHGKDWTIKEIAKHIGFYEKHNEQKNIKISPEERKRRIDELKNKLKG